MARNEVKVVITGDAARFKRSLDESESRLDKFSNKMGAIGSKLMGVGQALTASLTVPIVGAGIVATKWAMSAEEAANKVNVVFGDSAVFIQEWAKTAATSFGLSRGEALDAFGSIGTMLNGFGIETAKLPQMSDDILTLAADLGSFHNLKTPEVLDMISAAFRGEYDSIQRVIPTINAAAVEHKALEQTGKKSADQLTAQEKALAVYTLLMEGAGSATGDFERTQDSATNKTKIATANLKTAAETIGANLLPIVVKVADKIADLAEKFANLSPGMQKMILIGLAVVAAIGPIVSVVGALATAIGFIASPVGLVVAAIVALGAAFVWLYKNNEGFRTWVNDVASVIKDKLGQAVTWFTTDVWPKLVAAFFRFKDEVLPRLKDAWNDFVDNVWPKVLDAFNKFKDDVWPKLLDAFNKLKDEVLPWLVDKFNWFRDEVKPVMEEVAFVITTTLKNTTDQLFQTFNTFQTIWSAIISVVSFAFGVIAAVINANMGTIKGVISSDLQILRGLFQILGGAISGDWGRVWEGMKNVVSGAFNGMMTAFNFIFSPFKTALEMGVRNIKTTFDTVTSGLGSGFSTAFGAIKNAWNSTLGGKSITMPDLPGLPGRGQTYRFPTLHTGGIVPGPIGKEVMAKLQAGEAVLSIDQVRQLRAGAPAATMAGNGTTVINVTVNAGVGDPAEIGRKTVEAIRAYEARNGNNWRVA